MLAMLQLLQGCVTAPTQASESIPLGAASLYGIAIQADSAMLQGCCACCVLTWLRCQAPRRSTAACKELIRRLACSLLVEVYDQHEGPHSLPRFDSIRLKRDPSI